MSAVCDFRINKYDEGTDILRTSPGEAAGCLSGWADADNRVKSVNSGSVALDTYDADGSRVKKVTSAGTWYTFRDLDGNPVYEYKTGAGGGFLTYNHFFEGRLVFTNTALASPAAQWIYTDHLGSPRLRLDAAGTEKKRLWYYPYGEEFLPSADPIKYRYNAKELDLETGLYDYGARYYDALIGRFTAPDMPGADQSPSDPQSWNLYSYVRNNPTGYRDPTGQKATVTVETNEEEKTGTITVTATIAVYVSPHSLLTQTQINSAAGTIRLNINERWSGTFVQNGITYTVRTSVQVQVVSSAKAAVASRADNIIELQDGPFSSGIDSQVYNRFPLSSLFGTPDTGIWNIKTRDLGTPQHEFGHLLGVENRYSGSALMNAGILTTPGVSFRATADDFRWAFGGIAREHRENSRVILKFTRFGPPRSAKSVHQVYAPTYLFGGR